MRIKTVIKSRLREMGRSQYWLAGELGVSRQAVSKFIAGKGGAKVETLERMFKVLRLEVRAKD